MYLMIGYNLLTSMSTFCFLACKLKLCSYINSNISKEISKKISKFNQYLLVNVYDFNENKMKN